MNRHWMMIGLCLFNVIPVAATLPYTWAIVMQAAIGGFVIGLHAARLMRTEAKQ